MIQSRICILSPAFTGSPICLSIRLYRRNFSHSSIRSGDQRGLLSDNFLKDSFAEPLGSQDVQPRKVNKSPQSTSTPPPPSFPFPPASETTTYHASILVDEKVKTISNLLAIIRETEKRFGPILEYRCPTNFDSTRLGARIFVRFRDASSIAEIGDKPMFGYIVRAPNGLNPPLKPEGEGLTDIFDLLHTHVDVAEIRQVEGSTNQAPSLGSSSKEVAEQAKDGSMITPADPNATPDPDRLFVRIQVANHSQVTQVPRGRPHDDRARIRYMAMFLSGFQGFSPTPTPTMVNAQKFWTWQTRKLGAKPYPVPLRGAKVDYSPPRFEKRRENEGDHDAELKTFESDGVMTGSGKPILTEPLLTVESLKSTVPPRQDLNAAELEKEGVLRKAALRHALSQAPSLEHIEQKVKAPPKEEEGSVEMNDTVEKRRQQMLAILGEKLKQGGGLAKAYYTRHQGSNKASR